MFFLASLEVFRLKKEGYASPIEKRIEALRQEGGQIFVKKSGIGRNWRVKYSSVSHNAVLEYLFREQLNDIEYPDVDQDLQHKRTESRTTFIYH